MFGDKNRFRYGLRLSMIRCIVIGMEEHNEGQRVYAETLEVLFRAEAQERGYKWFRGVVKLHGYEYRSDVMNLTDMILHIRGIDTRLAYIEGRKDSSAEWEIV